MNILKKWIIGIVDKQIGIALSGEVDKLTSDKIQNASSSGRATFGDVEITGSLILGGWSNEDPKRYGRVFIDKRDNKLKVSQG